MGLIFVVLPHIVEKRKMMSAIFSAYIIKCLKFVAVLVVFKPLINDNFGLK